MNWDSYFLEICNTVGKNSKCLSRQIGAILVRDKSILTTGYNGPPRGVPHCGKERHPFYTKEMLNKMIDYLGHDLNHDLINRTCPRYLMGYKSGQGLEYCIAGHAERNTLLNAARNGIMTQGTSMYMNCPVPCKDCLIELINAGVKEVVCTDARAYYDEMSRFLVENSDLIVRDFHCSSLSL